MLNEGRIKDIAISMGYSDSQVEAVFSALNRANIVVIEKEDYIFDIKKKSNNEFIHTDVSIEMVIEIGFDVLRAIIETMIREEADESEIFELLRSLNSMYVNRKYVVRENNNEKYLALEI